MSKRIKKSEPKYLVLAAQFRERILSAALKSGDQLPTFAEACEAHSVTPGTVERAYSLLEREGLIERQQGRGTFVAHRQRTLTGNIGILGSDSLWRGHLAYYSLLMRGIEEMAAQVGCHLVFLGDSLRWDPKSCDKVDGILIVAAEQLAPIVQQLPADLPRVALLTGAEDVSSILADDYQGAALAVRYLLQQKHRRIACLMEKKPVLARRRLAGYRDALSEFDIEPETDWMRITPSVNTDKAPQPYLEWGRNQMLGWIKEGWSETRCTAIFVQNETAAIGVMQALQEAGIRVPQDVSVMGFDGTELCDLVSPRLCAVEVPLAQIGIKAMELLNRQIQHGREEVQAIVLPSRIREGASVAPPREYS